MTPESYPPFRPARGLDPGTSTEVIREWSAACMARHREYLWGPLKSIPGNRYCERCEGAGMVLVQTVGNVTCGLCKGNIRKGHK